MQRILFIFNGKPIFNKKLNTSESISRLSSLTKKMGQWDPMPQTQIF